MAVAAFPSPGFVAPRVQIFVSDLGATGVVRNAIAIANHAAAIGNEVRLLTCQSNGILVDHVDPRVTIVSLLDPAARLGRRARLRQTLLAYRRSSRAWRPDILFSAGNQGHLLSTLAWFGLPGSKLLRISNDLQHGAVSWPARLWRDMKFRLVTRLADRLVLVSRAQREHPLLGKLLGRGKAIVIPNGVDAGAVCMASRRSCPHIWAADRDVPIVLAVGRHAKQKNFPMLLRAFARARAHRPMRLIFLGDGPLEKVGRLRDLAAELGIAGDVDFVAASSDPFPYMSAARAVALPSLWEGSSNVLLEAMACGTPVIASRTAGDAEHVLDRGRYGALVDPHDLDALTAALLRQTGRDPIPPGDRAFEFSRSRAVDDYLRLFRQLNVGRRQGAQQARPAKPGIVSAGAVPDHARSAIAR